MWPKILAVVCSIALAAGYVGWRKHRADKAAEQAAKQAEAVEELTLMVGSKNPGRDVLVDLESLGEDFIIVEDPAELEKLEMDRTLMSSSKTMVPTEFLELDEEDLIEYGIPEGWLKESEQTPPVTEPEPRTLMPGSKSISGVFRPRIQPDPEPEPEEEEEP